MTRAVLCAALACAGLVGAVPAHVQTADYFGGYAGTTDVAPDVAARWLTWAETNIPDSKRIAPLGVKTLLYTDPNRQLLSESYIPKEEEAFAHDCSGNRIPTRRPNMYLMDPHAPAVSKAWRSHVQRYTKAGDFDAVFEDDAANVSYVLGSPCRYEVNDWIAATNALQRSLGFPVVYNGLSAFSGASLSPAIGLNATAIGGTMEQCYATSPKEPKASGAHWLVNEMTELRMQSEHKFFFCYGNDTSDPAASIDGRTYVYASFLLTYDPGTSVLWEYYGGTKRFHVMPESQFVALQPERPASSIERLREAGGNYVRAYRACYLAGRPVGPCAVAVNPDGAPHPLALTNLRHTLTITGGNVLSGGRAAVTGPAPPTVLPPLSATIAVK